MENILDLEETTQEDIIRNVEIMLQQRQKETSAPKKQPAKAQEIDLNVTTTTVSTDDSKTKGELDDELTFIKK